MCVASKGDLELGCHSPSRSPVASSLTGSHSNLLLASPDFSFLYSYVSVRKCPPEHVGGKDSPLNQLQVYIIKDVIKYEVEGKEGHTLNINLKHSET